jgi:fatty-acyl-CoA synthase
MVTLLAPLLRSQQTLWAGPLRYRDTALYANFWKIVAHYGISAMSAVPTVHAALTQCPVDADISSQRSAVGGASPLPPSVRKDFESHTGIALCEGYGPTEATAASARSFPDLPRPGSVGQRLPYQRAKTISIDDNGRWHDLAVCEVGHLVISGPTVFPGYVMNRGSDGFVLDGNGKFVDGWLDTGDLAWIDHEDFVHLTGRAKDLIIRGGHNIDPADDRRRPAGASRCDGRGGGRPPDEHAGEVPVAYVTVVAGAPATAHELQAWAPGAESCSTA